MKWILSASLSPEALDEPARARGSPAGGGGADRVLGQVRRLGPRLDDELGLELAGDLARARVLGAALEAADVVLMAVGRDDLREAAWLDVLTTM